jgi:filamentous hemagglutinin
MRLGENIASLLPVYGTPIALYQAISGESLSGENLTTVERFFNGVAAAVPLGSAAYRLINSAVANFRLAASFGGLGADGKALMDFSQLSSHQKGVVGELLGSNTVQNVLPGATRLGRMGEIGSRGIDDLYKVTSANADYVIVEYKFGTSTLGKTADGLQMSDGWVQGSDRILNAVGGNTSEALKISDAIASGRVEKWVVHTDPSGGTSVWVVDSAGKIVQADSTLASKVIGAKRR